MAWKWIRRVVQLLCLGLFVYLLALAAYDPRAGWPPELFLQLDPLAALSTAVSGYAIHRGLYFMALGLLTATFVLGRFFCGWICPLGTCIDVADWLLLRKRKRRREAANRPVLKYYLLIAGLAAAVLGVQWVWFLDPIPLVTRSFALVLYPLLSAGVNTVLVPGRRYALAAGLSADPWQEAQFQLALVAAAIFIGVLALSVLSRRYWCRTICPLGALLAFVGRFGLLKRKVRDNCLRCHLCLRDCKMGAIPADEPQVTRLPECILCFDCIVCKQQGIASIGLHWRRAGARPGTDAERRRALQAAGWGLTYGVLGRVALGRREHHPKLIRPPGAIVRRNGTPEPMSEEQFRATCVRCAECMKACPTNGLQPALVEGGFDAVFTPILVPRIGYCEQKCNACGRVCPTGALKAFNWEEKPGIKLGLATIDRNKCLQWRAPGRYLLCGVCYEHCVYEGVVGEQLEGELRPVVNPDKCIGCGQCERVCPVQPEAAITVSRSEAQQ